MKAAISYGISDIRVEEIPKPECPRDGLLMKVVYVTTCGTDVKTYRRGHVLFDPDRKRVFGHEGAGVVAETGPDCVTDFKVGDRIVVHNSAPCGNCYWCRRDQASLCENIRFLTGTWTEYVPIPASFVDKSAYHVPDDVPLEAAPLIEPMSCAVYGANMAGVELGDYVAINGAGPLGLGMTRAVSLLGGRVICCDKSEGRLELARKLGAEWTVKVAEGMDQIKAVRELTPNGRGADVVIEAVGLPETWELSVPMARKGGIVVFFGGCKRGTTVTLDTETLHYGQLTLKGIFHTTPRYEEMTWDLIRRGLLPRDLFVTGTYTLDNCVQALEDHAKQIGVKNLIVISEE